MFYDINRMRMINVEFLRNFLIMTKKMKENMSCKNFNTLGILICFKFLYLKYTNFTKLE